MFVAPYNDLPCIPFICTNTFRFVTVEKAVKICQVKNKYPFLLQIIPEDGRVIEPEWIQHYDVLPRDRSKYRFSAVGVDLAIAQNDRADYTAAVAAHIFGYENDLRIFISPTILNERLDFDSVCTRVTDLCYQETLQHRAEVVVETVGYQQVVPTELKKRNLVVTEYAPMQDKRARLNLVGLYIKRGNILFPKKGAERLIDQLVLFPNARHDDLVDALTTLILGLEKRLQQSNLSNVRFIGPKKGRKRSRLQDLLDKEERDIWKNNAMVGRCHI